MSGKEKRMLRILNNPKDVRFQDLDLLLLEMGFMRKQSGGGSSHYIYSHPNSDTLIVLAPHGNNSVLPEYQVKKANLSIKAIEDK